MSLPIYNIYIYIVPLLGAFKSQLGGTYNISLLLYTVNVYCDHIYIYIYIYSSNQFSCLCFLHVGCILATQFDKPFLFKCVTPVGFRHGGMSPSREYLSR